MPSHPRQSKLAMSLAWLTLAVAAAACRTPAPVRSTVLPKKPPVQVLQMEGVTLRATPGGKVVAEFRDATSIFEEGDRLFREKKFAAALGEWDRLLALHPQSKYRVVVHYNTGLALEKLERFDAALERYRRVVEEVPRTRDAIDAQFRAAECLVRLKRHREVADLFTQLLLRDDLKPADAFEARVRKGTAHAQLHEEDEAERTLLRAARYHAEAAKIDAVYDPSLLAQTFYYLGEVARRRMENAPLRLPQAQIEVDLNAKGHLLLTAQARFLRAIRTADSEWAPASGHQLGILYEVFHDHIMAAPVPPELNAHERGVYVDELRKKVRPLIRKAIAIYERNLSLAARLGGRSPWAEKTRARMDRLRALLDASDKASAPTSTPTTTGTIRPAEPPAGKPASPGAAPAESVPKPSTPAPSGVNPSGSTT